MTENLHKRRAELVAEQRVIANELSRINSALKKGENLLASPMSRRALLAAVIANEIGMDAHSLDNEELVERLDDCETAVDKILEMMEKDQKDQGD